jgi:microcystin-dependent protein
MSTNVGSVTKFFPAPQNGFSTTLTSSIASGATTVPLISTGAYANGDTVVLVIDPTLSSKQVFTGVINTGTSSVTGVKWTAGTNVGHTGGATIVDYTTATHIAMISKGILVEHNDDGTHKTNAVQLVYPVGSIYISVLATNPNSLFGFGTWVAFATGRTLVGIDTSQTEFATIQLTGGEKTHTLSTGEMPSHNHGVNDPGHSHSVSPGGFGAGPADGSKFRVDVNSPANPWNSNTSGSGTGISTQNTGSGGAHNNLQPYITVYMWRRTA